jgi:hypothetical protein
LNLHYKKEKSEQKELTSNERKLTEPMKKKFKESSFFEYFKKFLGIIPIIGGIFGLLVPFLQGIAMILAGFVLLGNQAAIEKLYKLRIYLKRTYRQFIDNWR